MDQAKTASIAPFYGALELAVPTNVLEWSRKGKQISAFIAKQRSRGIFQSTDSQNLILSPCATRKGCLLLTRQTERLDSSSHTTRMSHLSHNGTPPDEQTTLLAASSAGDAEIGDLQTDGGVDSPKRTADSSVPGKTDTDAPRQGPSSSAVISLLLMGEYDLGLLCGSCFRYLGCACTSSTLSD